MEQQRAAVHLRRLLIAAALLVLAAPAHAATPWCLPPLFEGGQRLHTTPAPRATWLSVALRQHQLCWQTALRPERLRVVVLGSSAVFGLGVWASETFSALLNAEFAADGIDATVFNLAWVNPYQLRDALVLREAMAFRPDVIVYPVTMSEFVHVAPTMWKPLNAFFRTNRDRLRAMAAAPPRGLHEPIERYQRLVRRWDQQATPLERLREIGSFARAATADLGTRLVRALGAVVRAPGSTRRPRQAYDCDRAVAEHRQHFADWQSWNILEELEALQGETGVQVLLVYWPLGANPSGQCFNARFTYTDVLTFGAWMTAEARRRGFAYVDLSRGLDDADFFDSLHVDPAGHRKIATALRAPLLDLLERVRR